MKDLDGLPGFSVCVIVNNRELWMGLQKRDAEERRVTNRSESLIDGCNDVRQVFSLVLHENIQCSADCSNP